MSRVLAILLVSCAIAAGCVSPAGTKLQPGSTSATDLTSAGVTAIVNKVGDAGSLHAVSDVKPLLQLIGHDAAEPTIGVLQDGTLFYAAATFKNDIAGVSSPLPRTDILRSKDGAKTWEDVTPFFPGHVVREHPDTGDPYVYVDTGTGRVFDIDQRLLTTCYTVITSDDAGATWTLPPSPACTTPGLADHQTIVAAKPKMLPVPPLYPKIVYVCYNVIATSACVRSLDGARTFEATGPVGTRGVDPSRVGPGTVSLNQSDPTNPNVDPMAICSGLVGHLRAAPDGTVFLPRRECSTGLAFSTSDDGLTWDKHVVADDVLNEGGTAGMDPVIAIDGATVYYLYQAADGHLHLATSADDGATWTKPVDLLAPGLTVGNLATMASGANGTLAIAYYGSNVKGGLNATHDDAVNATWNGYLATVTNAATPTPTLITTRVNPANDPLYRGECGVGRCGSVRDFIDIAIDADGRPWATFVDACTETCAAAGGKSDDSTAFAGALATLTTGPDLWAPEKTLVAIHPVKG